MLDMGFLPDIKRIMALLPTDRQSLFFSATLPPNIVALSQKILEDPKKVTIKPEQPTAERVEQSTIRFSDSDSAESTAADRSLAAPSSSRSRNTGFKGERGIFKARGGW